MVQQEKNQLTMANNLQQFKILTPKKKPHSTPKNE